MTTRSAEDLATEMMVLRETVRDYQSEIKRLTQLGDEMATQIEDRWTGPHGCGCVVCSAALAWRAATTRDRRRHR